MAVSARSKGPASGTALTNCAKVPVPAQLELFAVHEVGLLHAH